MHLRDPLRSRLIERIERVDLRVQHIERAVAFYRDVAGLQVVEQTPTRASLGDGSDRVFLTLDSAGVTEPADPYATGLFHTAIRFPSRASLGDALARVAAAGLEIGAGDHLVSEALYVDDPDRNGVELYWDRPVEEWPAPTETMVIPMATLPVDLDSLLNEGVGSAAVGASAPGGTDIGHVHLQVSDLKAATRFYAETLGLDQTAALTGSAGFFSSNGYHHHIGANIWRSRHGRAAPRQRAGLTRVIFSVGSSGELESLCRRMEDAGHGLTRGERGSVTLADPDGIELVFRTTTSSTGGTGD